MKNWRWIEILLVVAVMAAAGYAAFSDARNFPNRWFTRDDAYYYFKVSQNITEGNGISFDGINLANGYHPLWMSVCIPIFALARFDLILPLRVLLLLMGALSAGTGVLLYRLLSRVLSKRVGALAAAFWVFSIYVHETVTQYGLETGITAFSIVLLIYSMESFERKWRKEKIPYKQITGFALVALLVLFSRLDTIFLVIAFGFYLVFRASPLRHYLLIDIVGIVLVGFASFVLRLGMGSYYPYTPMATWMVLLSLLVNIPLYYFAGLYQPPRTQRTWQILRRVALAVTVGAGIVSALMLVFADNFPRRALVLNWGFLLLLVGGTRIAVRYLSRDNIERAILSPLQLLNENWKNWLSEGALYYGIVGGALAFYMLASKLIFGTSSPISGQIKRWWGSLSGKVYGGPAKRIYTFFGLDTTASDFDAWGLVTRFVVWLRDSLVRWVGYSDTDAAYWWLFLLVGIIILIILIADRKRTIRASVRFGLLPLLVGAELQVIYYNALGYSAAKEWYWASQMLFTLLLAALLLDIFLRALQWLHPFMRYLAWAGTAALIFIWGQAFYEHTARLMPYGVEHPGHPYMEILAVVEENTEPGSLIGMTGGGNIGYFIADRTIVNMDGLINSYAYFQALQNGRADEYLAGMGLDYIFANPALLENIPYKGQFTGRLGEPIANYAKKDVIEFYSVEGSTP